MTAVELAGVVADLPEADYHAHGAVSASDVKLLLPPSCPALYRHYKDNGRPDKRAFDLGHAAHAQLLGVGGEFVVVKTTGKDGTSADAEDYRAKSAQEHRDTIRAAGKTPLLASEASAVDAMVSAVRAHPRAARLLADGRPELSLFWEDWAHGVSRRARLDWLTADEDGRATIVDLKTTTCAEPAALRKTFFSYGYHLQAATYLDGVHELGLGDDPRFLFVCVEKTPPHLVTVVELDAEAIRVGRSRVDEGLRIYADCAATGRWPGYADDVQVLSLPPWAAPQEVWEQP